MTGGIIDVILPINDDIDVFYTCSTSIERNVIATITILQHVKETHPIMKPGNDDYSAYDGVLRHPIVL